LSAFAWYGKAILGIKRDQVRETLCGSLWLGHASSDEGLEELALWVYREVFEDGRPPAHILLRDYARGIIELAARCGLDLEIDMERVRPPTEANGLGTSQALTNSSCRI